MKKLIYIGIASLLMMSSCDDDEVNVVTADFTVTIENVSMAKTYLDQGVFNTPVGASEPGAAGSGNMYQFSFNAGSGSYLSFTTMFVQSNDLFYAPAEMGIALYDNGMALTGDITSQIFLWDAGTEVNEEPGTGANQPPRQSGANTGTDESGTVELISNITDGFTYPTVAEALQVSISHDGGTMFTVSISNISGTGSFETPIAPGVYAVHGSGASLFTEGSATTNGLEGLAEDGDPSNLSSTVGMDAGLVSPLAPGIFAIHGSSMPIFVSGSASSAGLESLAEDGDPSTLIGSVEMTAGVSNSAVFNTPVGGSGAAPAFPGDSYSFTFSASDGDYLSLATMFVQSNDLFYAFDDGGIQLFHNGSPVSGDMTGQLSLWDAGTEVNEFPGAGHDQAPRQAMANTGADESGNVMMVNDSFAYPASAAVIKVTITSVAN